jgi:methyltransferase (TIGR00027 family)
MWCAWARNYHATVHPSPIFSDTRSIQLVPHPGGESILSTMDGLSREAADALILLPVIRQRVLIDRLPSAHERGIRQLVILGAGLDITGFELPAWAKEWRVFEVDHPATQEWKRKRILEVGWEGPANLAYAPCDFEERDLIRALEAVGFNRREPVVVSLFGVLIYLTARAAKSLLTELATLAPGSEVTLTYESSPDGTDPVVQETYDKLTPIVDTAGERFLNFYDRREIASLALAAGFRDAVHHPVDELNARYFSGRSDGLRLRTIERLLTAVC